MKKFTALLIAIGFVVGVSSTSFATTFLGKNVPTCNGDKTPDGDPGEGGN